jgi:molybdopterin molybdotransferase
VLDYCTELPESVDTKTLPVEQAAGYVAASALNPRGPIPPFKQSAMDGYAICSEDLTDPQKAETTTFALTAEIAAGDDPSDTELQKGEAVRIFTGAPLPGGADTVVRQERVSRDGEDIQIPSDTATGKDVRPPGEHYAEDQKLLSAGQRITSRDISTLAECGRAEIPVYRKPRVAVLTTGDEVVPTDADLKPGQVYDANTPYLVSWLEQRDYETEATQLEDTKEALVDALQARLETTDLIITTGGVSVGDYDYVLEAAREVGFDKIFWKVKQKPGKPLFVGKRQDTVLLGLPGNPYAVRANLPIYGARLLDAMQGCDRPEPRFKKGILDFSPRQSQSRVRWQYAEAITTDDGELKLIEAETSAAPQGQPVLAKVPAQEEDRDARVVGFTELS